MAGLSMAAATTTYALLVFSLCCLPPPAGSVSFNYSAFSSADLKDIRVELDAYINSGLIEVSANRLLSIGGSRGRASYNHPVPLWDSASGEAASFTTRFSFVIDPDPPGQGGINNKGTGMAFFLTGYRSSLPASSPAYNIGLTNQSNGAKASGEDRFVAVEFDTFNDTAVFDPHDTYDHIGIDVNSLISVNTSTLPSFTLTGNLTAEITYDNVSSILAMTLWLGDDRNETYNVSSKVDLKSALPEQVAVGFSASTSTSVELHQVRSWYFSSSLETKSAPPPSLETKKVPPPSLETENVPPPSSSRAGVIAGITGGVALFTLCVTAALFIRRRNNMRKKIEEDIGSEDEDGEPIMEIEMGTGPRRFPYDELLNATRSFAFEAKLGQGGFGAVYRGYLEDLGLAVAIKRFAKESSMQGRKEYKSEIKVISRLRHRNLVKLIGWCHSRHELLLVYELMPNRSLDIHLYSKDTILTWPRRVKIVLGLGSALLYLHEEWEQCVVHRDIKPSNVMLDESFNAKLGDFGLARLIDHAVGMQTMTAVSGTPGYVDPQSLFTGWASAESDVYSFGVLLLEVACGRRPVSLLLASQDGGVFLLVEWVWDLYGRGAVLEAADERLNGDYDAAEMERVMVVGLWCAHPDPSARPSIKAAMAVLQSKEANQLPVLPAKMPVPTYAPVALPEGLISVGASSTGMSSSSATQSSTASGYATHTSSSSDTGTSTGSKDSSLLLKHQY